MTQVIVDDALAETIVSAATDFIELRDRSGRYVGRVVRDGITQADIDEAKRRLASDQPSYTTAEVLAYLDELASQ